MAGIKCIGILTSGGDAPGMNAAIRAVTRSAIYNGFAVKGIMRGYKGLVFNEIVSFKSQSVSNIIQLGGTILKTARSQEFTTTEGRKAAYDNMVAAGIDALVVIGGDGSLTGAGIFAEEYNVPIVESVPPRSATTRRSIRSSKRSISSATRRRATNGSSSSR